MALPKEMTVDSTASRGTTASSSDQSTVSQAISKMNQLLDAQRKVDAALERMPPSADKTRLLKERDSNRGYIFTNIILPAWAKIREWTGAGATAAPMAGFDAEPLDEAGAFGVLPLVPVAVIAASTAILAYVGTTYATEAKILNDPALSAAQKTQLLQSKGVSSVLASAGGIVGEVKWIALAGAVAFLAFQYMKTRRADR